MPRSRVPLALAAAALVAVLTGCADPEYDFGSPQAAIDSTQRMITDGRPDLLPGVIHIEPREIVFADGVTEASAIGDVREKAGDMLGQLWRVTEKLRTRFPDQVEKELALAESGAEARGFGPFFARLLSDPFAFLEEQRGRLVAEDLGDGTAALLVDDEPAFGGAVTLVETSDGWRLSIPVAAVRGTGYWPETREEWAVVASMMLAVENALIDFERKLDDGEFRNLRQASEQAGFLLGSSVTVQSIIYATMKQKGPDERPVAAEVPDRSAG